MSGSAMLDGLKTLYSAASLFGTGMVSIETFDVLETCSGSCLVLSEVGMASEDSAWGTRDHVRRFRLDVFLKATGDPFAYRKRKLTATDLVIAAIEDDPTIQGTAESIGRLEMNFEPNMGIKIGGQDFTNARFTLEAKETAT